VLERSFWVQLGFLALACSSPPVVALTLAASCCCLEHLLLALQDRVFHCEQTAEG